MTANYFYWQTDELDPHTTIYNYPSPNVKAIMAYLLATYGGQSVGIGPPNPLRPVRGGEKWSTHCYGAAGDWRYLSTTAVVKKGVTVIPAGGRDITVPLDVVLADLIANSNVFGIQMIGEEAPRPGSPNGRIWKCDRQAWKNRPLTAARGGAWLHIETTLDDWHNGTPLIDRLPEQDDEMVELIKVAGDSLVLAVDGLKAYHVRNRHPDDVVQSMIADKLVKQQQPREVARASYAGLVICTPIVYDPGDPTPDDKKTKPSDFMAAST